MPSEKQRQSSKEKSVLIALQNNQALIRRELEIHAMNKDGSIEFVSKSLDYDNLWQDSLKTLKKKYKNKKV
jgi:hypothetical protein